MKNIIISTIGFANLICYSQAFLSEAKEAMEKDKEVIYNGPAIHKVGETYYINVPDECQLLIKDTKDGREKHFGFKKLRWDPRTNEIDTSDLTFTYTGLDFSLCSLEGTHFVW